MEYFFCMMSWKILDFWQENPRFCKNCSLFLHRNIFREKVTCFIISWKLNGNFSKFGLKMRGKSVETAFYVPRGSFEEINSFLECCYFVFCCSIFSGKFLGCRQKKIRHIIFVKSEFYLFTWIKWGRKIEQIYAFFRFFAEKLSND